MKRIVFRGSYDRSARVRSFDELSDSIKLRYIRKAFKCGCPGCCAWLERIPSELVERAMEKRRRR